MSQIVTDIVIGKTFVHGDDVLTWFDLHTARTDPLPTVNWRHVRNGKIAWIRVTFDPRPLSPPCRWPVVTRLSRVALVGAHRCYADRNVR
ncbi:MAG TPA: hypothetical protein VME44_05470 [Streptosporangiaceae bacterium]|nr:hypothetical protein [Streptosporangiaceae bacterium]